MKDVNELELEPAVESGISDADRSAGALRGRRRRSRGGSWRSVDLPDGYLDLGSGLSTLRPLSRGHLRLPSQTPSCSQLRARAHTCTPPRRVALGPPSYLPPNHLHKLFSSACPAPSPPMSSPEEDRNDSELIRNVLKGPRIQRACDTCRRKKSA